MKKFTKLFVVLTIIVGSTGFTVKEISNDWADRPFEYILETKGTVRPSDYGLNMAEFVEMYY